MLKITEISTAYIGNLPSWFNPIKEDPTRLALFLIIATAPLTTVKFFDIQLSEWLSGLALGLAWLKSDFRQHENKNFLRYQRVIWIFLLLLLITALFDTWALSIPAQEGQGLLKRPYLLSIARVSQLFLATQAALLLWKKMQVGVDFANRAAGLYVQVGFWACVFAIINFGLCRYGIEIPLPGKPSYIGMPRAQGTFVEPGPFGLFVVSLLLMEGIRLRLSGNIDPLKWAVFALALLLTVSKSGFMALTLMAPMFLIHLASSRYKKALLTASLIVTPLLAMKIAEDYTLIISSIDYASHPFLSGRMMAFHALPRMLAHSPWLGIGIGNYPLMRNSPDILDGMPPSPIWDLHGSGLMGVAVEIGIPLFIGFIILLIRPILVLQENLRDPWLKTACWFPLIAFLTGVQIHFIYPWLFMTISVTLMTKTKIRQK